MSSLPKIDLVCQAPSLFDASSDFPDIIAQYLPSGGLNLLAGAPGVGKTAFVAGLLRDIRDGRLIFGHTPTRVPAMGFIGTDRSWKNGAGWWFDQVGFSEILAYSMQDDPTYNIKGLRKRHDRTDILASFIDRLKLPPGSLITVDPITPFMGGNLLDYDTCFVASQEIQRHLKLRGYTLLGTAHSSKQKTNKQDRYLRLQDRTLGSTALIGFGDTAMYLASPEEIGKPYYAFHWQPHRAKAETHYLTRDAQGLFLPHVATVDLDGASQIQVLALLPSEASAAVEFSALVDLAAAIPLSSRTVKRALHALVRAGAVQRVSHGRYCRVQLQ